MFDGRAHRATNLDVAQRRRAFSSVRPFLRRFDGWHTRAALAHALLIARRGDEDDARRRLTELKQEVEAAYKDFRQAVAQEPPHSTIRDVDRTFSRLLRNISVNIPYPESEGSPAFGGERSFDAPVASAQKAHPG